jgi:hypothetical protein
MDLHLYTTLLEWGRGAPFSVQLWSASVSPVLCGHAVEHTEYVSGKLPSPVVVVLLVEVPLPRVCVLPMVIVSAAVRPEEA